MKNGQELRYTALLEWHIDLMPHLKQCIILAFSTELFKIKNVNACATYQQLFLYAKYLATRFQLHAKTL